MVGTSDFFGDSHLIYLTNPSLIILSIPYKTGSRCAFQYVLTACLSWCNLSRIPQGSKISRPHTSLTMTNLPPVRVEVRIGIIRLFCIIQSVCYHSEQITLDAYVPLKFF